MTQRQSIQGPMLTHVLFIGTDVVPNILEKQCISKQWKNILLYCLKTIYV